MFEIDRKWSNVSFIFHTWNWIVLHYSKYLAYDTPQFMYMYCEIIDDMENKKNQ